VPPFFHHRYVNELTVPKLMRQPTYQRDDVPSPTGRKSKETHVFLLKRREQNVFSSKTLCLK
jgi:hypothetical protein